MRHIGPPHVTHTHQHWTRRGTIPNRTHSVRTRSAHNRFSNRTPSIRRRVHVVTCAPKAPRMVVFCTCRSPLLTNVHKTRELLGHYRQNRFITPAAGTPHQFSNTNRKITLPSQTFRDPEFHPRTRSVSNSHLSALGGCTHEMDISRCDS